MKLRNKKTGEIMPASNIAVGVGEDGKWYDNISELTDEWEDYEEPKEYYFIDDRQGPYESNDTGEWIDEQRREIGNYFETKEEAEKAVEKLKAWKRLRDKGFKFEGLEKELKDVYGNIAPTYIRFNKGDDFKWFIENKDDLFLLFGGEE